MAETVRFGVGAMMCPEFKSEAKASLQEGIRLWIEIAREDGTDVPPPSSDPAEGVDARAM